MSVLYKLRGIVNHSIMRNMYYSFIYPLLTYGLVIWGHNYKNNLQKIVILQKRALRIINNQPYLAHTDTLFKGSDILKFHDVCTLESLKFVYKFKLGLLPETFCNYFSFVESSTRQSSLIKVPFARTNYKSFSIQIQGAKLFNQYHTRIPENLNSLKAVMKHISISTLESY